MRYLVLVIAGLALLAPVHATPASAQYGGWPVPTEEEEYDADNDFDVDQDVDVDVDRGVNGKEPYHEELDPGYDGYDHGDEAPPPEMRGDQTWRGDDGRYYCRRPDGTTGAIVGGGAGALIGRGFDTRGERGTGTIIGAIAGALLGRAIERGPRCR
jgi:hypothetical protein